MTKKTIKKQLSQLISKNNILRITILLASSYLFCIIFDPLFFNYESSAIIIRQIYGVCMAMCFLIICTQLPYLGICIYTVSCLIFGILAYAKKQFGYELTNNFISAICETTYEESSAFITWGSLLSLAGFIIAATAIFCAAKRCLNTKRYRKQWWKHALLCFVAIIIALPMYWVPGPIFYLYKDIYRRFSSRDLQCDTNMFKSYCPHIAIKHWRSPWYSYKDLANGIASYFKFMDIAEAAQYPSNDADSPPSITFIFIIGEALRADHLGLNGYHRNTTPKLSTYTNLYSFSQFYSYAAATYPSCLGIFGGLSKTNEPTAKTSFVSILKKHGFHASFFFENTYNISEAAPLNLTVYKYLDKCQVLYTPITEFADTVIKEARQTSSAKKIIMIENGTGHYPYQCWEQYSIFQPSKHQEFGLDAKEKRKRTINAYDNTILAIDDMCSRLIDGVKDQNAVVFYCSDHGELLGEYGKYFHGHDHIPLLRHVASFIWFSDEYKRSNPKLVQQIIAIKDKPLIQGQIYATILRLCGIESEVPLNLGDFVDDNFLQHENNLPPTLLYQIKEEYN